MDKEAVPRSADQNGLPPQSPPSGGARKVRAVPANIGLLVVWMLGLMAVGFSTLSIYTPSMPAIAAYFDASSAQVQMTISVYMFAFAIAQLVYGPLADRRGRRPALFLGLMVFIAGSAICFLASSIEVLTVGRAVQAFGACSGPVVSRAVLRDSFSRDRAAQIMAYVGMAIVVAPAFAPVLGGYLQVAFGWQSIFVFLSALGALMLFVTWTGLEETNSTPASAIRSRLRDMFAAYPAMLRSRRFIAFTLQNGFGAGAIFTYMAGAPFVLIEMLGVRPDLYGWFVLFPSLFNFLGSFVASRFTVRLGGDRMVVLGSIVICAGGLSMLGLALAGITGVVAIVGPAALILFGLANTWPSSSQGAINAFPERAGTASSLNGFLMMSTAAAATLVAGMLRDGTQLPMTYVVAGCSVAAFLSLALVPRGDARNAT